jgi:hypothetical protein
VGFQENYPGVLNGDNLADVLKAAREKREVIFPCISSANSIK